MTLRSGKYAPQKYSLTYGIDHIRLRQIRKEFGMTQVQMAELVGYSFQWYRKMECGDESITVNLRLALKRALLTRLDQLKKIIDTESF